MAFLFPFTEMVKSQREDGWTTEAKEEDSAPTKDLTAIIVHANHLSSSLQVVARATLVLQYRGVQRQLGKWGQGWGKRKYFAVNLINLINCGIIYR